MLIGEGVDHHPLTLIGVGVDLQPLTLIGMRVGPLRHPLVLIGVGVDHPLLVLIGVDLGFDPPVVVGQEAVQGFVAVDLQIVIVRENLDQLYL